MPQITKNPIIMTLSAKIRPELKSHFVDWQSKLNTAITGFDGFISLEFISLPDQANQQSNWKIIQRFDNAENSTKWRDSPQGQELITELQSFTVKNSIEEKIEGEENLRNGVTEVIIAQVDPSNEKSFREWSAKIHQVEAKFHGFRGVYIQSPKHGHGTHWITILQFDSSENLERWLNSSERQEILKESSHLISSLETHRVESPYAGWFNSIAHTEEIPAVWKQTMMVLLVLFPIVMLELKYLSPLTSSLNISLGTFIGNAISVSLISFPFMPLAIGLLGWWIFPKNKYHTLLGTLIVLGLYLVEIAIFWSFF